MGAVGDCIGAHLQGGERLGVARALRLQLSHPLVRLRERREEMCACVEWCVRGGEGDGTTAGVPRSAHLVAAGWYARTYVSG